jgi:hypothetical protein
VVMVVGAISIWLQEAAGPKQRLNVTPRAYFSKSKIVNICMCQYEQSNRNQEGGAGN